MSFRHRCRAWLVRHYWLSDPKDQELFEQARNEAVRAEEQYKEALVMAGKTEILADNSKRLRQQNHFGPAVAATFNRRRLNPFKKTDA